MKVQGDQNPDDRARNEGSNQPEPRRLSRRKLIHILAAGGAITSAKLLPDRWVKPAVDSIMLPAHARSSPGEEGPSPFPGDFDEQDVRSFLEDLSPEQLQELRSQLSSEEQQQLDEFLQ